VIASQHLGIIFIVTGSMSTSTAGPEISDRFGGPVNVVVEATIRRPLNSRRFE